MAKNQALFCVLLSWCEKKLKIFQKVCAGLNLVSIAAIVSEVYKFIKTKQKRKRKHESKYNKYYYIKGNRKKESQESLGIL